MVLLRSLLVGSVVVSAVLAPRGVTADEPVLPPGDEFPVLRLNAEGPLSYVPALAFGPDGETLYGGGWDKVVHVWRRREGRFVYDRQSAFRIPIGAGLDGGINAIAVSPTGRWLAVGGRGRTRDVAGLRETGWIWPSGAMSAEMRRDLGLIYVFDTRTRRARLLRGHTGPVTALRFAPAHPDKPPVLVSAADEYRAEEDGYEGRLRVWDLQERRQIAQLPGLPRTRWLPHLSVRHTGRRPTDMRIAVGWGDDTFRVWDVGRNRWSPSEFGEMALTAEWVPGPAQRILAGRAGAVGLWTVPGRPEDPLVLLRRERHFRPIVGLGAREAPMAATTFSDGPESAPGYAAVVVAEARSDEQWRYVLRILDLDRNTAVGQGLPLWSGRPKQPAVAADPQGRYLAVSGGPDHDVRLYRIADLLAGRAKPRQRLHGVGLTVRSAAFARKGDDVGLVLRERAPAGPGRFPREVQADDRIFDIAGRTVTREPEGWKAVAPQTGPWSIEFAASEATGEALSVLRDGRPVADISLQDEERLTAYALCPPTDHCPIPLAAVALHIHGEPELRLYNGKTGHQVRRFTGHSERVRCVAFSADGTLLVSAGEDRTVRVWSTLDLAEENLGRHGLLRGVKLRDRDGRIVVTASATEALRPGDRLQGALEDGELHRFDRPGEVYHFFLGRSPGSRVTLQVRRQNATHRVTVPVDQAIDERKPLFSLFMVPAEQQTEWIGWHPLGPYDSSGRDVERHLGWHFNTDDPREPAKYALAGEYRRQNHHRGVLEELLKRHELPPPPGPEDQPPPEMSLLIHGRGEAKRPLVTEDYGTEGGFFARTPRMQLEVRLEEFPLRRVESLAWDLDRDGHFRTLEASPTSPDLWEADLSAADWTPAVHTVRVRLKTREYPSREFFETVSVRFQPPAPEITTPLEADSVQTSSSEFRFRARVTDAHVPAEVVLRNRGEAVWRGKVRPGTPLKIDHRLELEPGMNPVEVIARNSNALEEYESFETAWLSRWIERTEAPAAEPPSLALERLRPSPAGEPRAIQPGQPLLVEVPEVLITGHIEAGTPLQSAIVTTSNREDPVPLKGFRPGEIKRFEFEQPVALQPGRQTIRFRAGTEGGDEEARLVVDYRPALPRVGRITWKRRVANDLPEAARIEEDAVYEHYHRREIELSAPLSRPEDRRPFDAAVVRKTGASAQELKVPVEIEEATLQATVPLVPGSNPIQIRLSNRWGRVRLTEPLEVRYLRPPRFVEVTAPEETDRREHDLTAVIESPTEPRLEIAVNDLEDIPAEVRARRLGESETRWEVTARGIPLPAEENRVRLVARNRDGASLRPRTYTVQGPPPGEPPRIELLQPAVDNPVQVNPLSVVVRIRSDQPVQEAALSVENESGHRRIPLDDATPGRRISQDVELAPGDNRLTVTARNGSGLGRAGPVTVRYVPKPVSIAIEKVIAPEDREFEPQLEDGRIRLGRPVPAGRIRLRGRIRWLDPEDDRRRSARSLKVWVNGFLYPTVQVSDSAADPREQIFTAEIALNRTEENLVEIEPPEDLPISDADRRRLRLRIDCRNPVRKQRLHLLIVGPNLENGRQVREQLLQALQVTEADGRMRTPAFQRVITYPRSGVLSGWVTAGTVRAQLDIMARSILQLDHNLAKDVILIYYRGTEVVGPQGELFLTTSDYPEEPEAYEDSLSVDDLTRRLNRTGGAHLVLFDVTRRTPAGRPVVRESPDDPYLGIFRGALRTADETADEARLIHVLQQAVGRADPGTLGQVRQQVAQHYRRLRIPGLTYELRVPDILENLALK